MSSSDDHDDENIKKIQQAVDTSLLFNDLYKKNECFQIYNNFKAEVNVPKGNNREQLKSQRYLIEEEFFDVSYIKVSEAMQNFVAKKLSNLIEKKFEFVEMTYNKKIFKKFLKEEAGIKLLKGCESDIDMKSKILINGPTVKPIIKKRKFEADHDDHLTENDKIKLVSVTAEDIINRVDMKYWRDRKKSKIFTYKSKSGPPFQFVEPDNEFSVRRRKNNWSMKKIARKNKVL